MTLTQDSIHTYFSLTEFALHDSYGILCCYRLKLFLICERDVTDARTLSLTQISTTYSCV